MGAAWMDMEIFLTGGTGYLGGRLAERLAAAGHRVRLLYRSPDHLPQVPSGVLPVRGDLLRVDDLRDAVRGVDAIVHTAALVRSHVPDPSQMEATNVGAVRGLIDLTRELGIPKLVYTSSFMALGPSGASPIDERSDIRRTSFHNHYERTKYLGNEAAREGQAAGAPVVILYPTVIFGPGALTGGNHVGRLIRDYLRRRLPGRLGRPDALWNYAYVEDVVAGHLLALERARAGSRYILGGENVTMAGFLAALEEISGIEPPRRRISRPVAKVLGSLFELAAGWTENDPPLTRAVVDIYERDWAYSCRLAMDELGYRPTPFREALSATVVWLRGDLAAVR